MIINIQFGLVLIKKRTEREHVINLGYDDDFFLFRIEVYSFQIFLFSINCFLLLLLPFHSFFTCALLIIK